MRAPIRGAVTQGPTIRADNDPIIPTPKNVPELPALDLLTRKFCITVGIWILKKSNIASANIKNKSANEIRTYGFWRFAWILIPDDATSIPMRAYVTDIAITYVNDMANALRVLRLLPWPTIIPVNIGIIGKTQGVNASNIPAKKNNIILRNNDWLARLLLIEIWSLLPDTFLK